MSSLSDKQLNPPVLSVGLIYYWTAFWTLAADRAIGMGEGPIPWTAVHMYAVSREMDLEEERRLYNIVRAMDKVYLSVMSKKQSAEMRKASKTNSKETYGKYIPAKQ